MIAERPAAQPMKSLDDALSHLLGHAVVLEGVEQVPTFDADGRVLAQDLVSELQVPAHDNSSMDGYAVRTADVSHAGTPLQVTQRIAAGSVSGVRSSRKAPAMGTTNLKG